LIRYCGVEDTPLNRAIGWKFLCGAVRRAKQPGCKFDHALILEGKQKIGKSTVVEILASGPGDGYYTDAEGKKEQQELVKGIWFYELSELTGIRKADAQSVLHFISRKKERGRMAYAHFVPTDLRSVVFVGTTNDQEYLVAQDGNRRFWSVWCNPVVGSKLDTDGLRRDLGQLFAEAVVVEPEEALWIGDDLWTEAEALQESRRVKHPWEDTLAALCYTVANGPKKAALPDGKKEWRIHTETIYESHLKIPVAHRTDGDHKRLSSIMQRHGWEKKSSLRIGQVVRAGYVKEVEETAV